MSAVLFVSGVEPPEAFALLSHNVSRITSTARALSRRESADVIVVDGRTELANARTACHTLSQGRARPSC